MIGVINAALTGLVAAGNQLAASASNIANLQTVGSLEEGGQAPYTPLHTQKTGISDGQGNGRGVKVTFTPKTPSFVPAYDPDSSFSNQDGLIGVPNINLAEEAVNASLAEVQYKANLKTIEVASELSDEVFRLFDDEV